MTSKGSLMPSLKPKKWRHSRHKQTRGLSLRGGNDLNIPDHARFECFVLSKNGISFHSVFLLSRLLRRFLLSQLRLIFDIFRQMAMTRHFLELGHLSKLGF